MRETSSCGGNSRKPTENISPPIPMGRNMAEYMVKHIQHTKYQPHARGHTLHHCDPFVLVLSGRVRHSENNGTGSSPTS